ncbi:MAG TPA: hypothetical protein VFF52_21220 [Isosphaeraceae bacterium]|nr:hypothetical protein [Isosphaeraceae bacterium]
MRVRQDESRNQSISLKSRENKDVVDSSDAFPEGAVTLRPIITRGLDGILEDMSEELGLSKGLTIIRALELLQVALDAHKEGKGIAIVDDDLNVEQEIEVL